MIFGVAVVFPVVITFGVDSPASRLARRTATGADKRRPLCTGEQRPRAGTLLVIIIIIIIITLYYVSESNFRSKVGKNPLTASGQTREIVLYILSHGA